MECITVTIIDSNELSELEMHNYEPVSTYRFAVTVAHHIALSTIFSLEYKM